MWTDSHCHVWTPAAIGAARASEVDRIVMIGTDLESSAEAIGAAGEHDGVWATVGVHPHEASKGTDGVEGLLASTGVVAVGECGLDYHYEHSPREVQRPVFAEQIAWAHSHDLALVIHSRDAWEDTFAVLRSEGVPDRTVFHCFTGGPAEAQIALDLGASLSFSGIVTFKGADDVRAAAALCPGDRLLVETDAPYLAPVPVRGKPNEPAFVCHVGAGVALARKSDVDAVAVITTANAERVFMLT